MNKPSKTILTVLAVASMLMATGCGEKKNTAEPRAKGVTITDPWARVTTPHQEMGAAYMTISSTGGDTLLKAKVPTSLADHAELHKAVMAGKDDAAGGGMGADMDSPHGGKMTMKLVHSIAVPAGGSIALKPGGFHVMLIDLKKPIAAGDEIKLTLTFAKAGEIQVIAVAKD